MTCQSPPFYVKTKVRFGARLESFTKPASQAHSSQQAEQRRVAGFHIAYGLKRSFMTNGFSRGTGLMSGTGSLTNVSARTPASLSIWFFQTMSY